MDIRPVAYKLVEKSNFYIIGRQTFISGQDNEQFSRFWDECRSQGWLSMLDSLKQSSGTPAGPQTGAAYLGVSRVEKDPADRTFNYMIAIEIPGDKLSAELSVLGLETCLVPACTWAVFECHGKPPMSIVEAEMFAFGQWLPSSSYRHAFAPEMEVYPADAGEDFAEFWLPAEPLK
jgi:AraC family transcriptional regulator